MEVDEALIDRAERDREFQSTYPNEFPGSEPYFVHPCFVRTPVRIDKLTTRWAASQADMYRMLLRLPFDAEVELPLVENRICSDRFHYEREVVMITDSTSWPNTQPGFWPKLAARLTADGWQVHVNDKTEDLDNLLARCRRAAWVIGPQCGVMSILVSGEFSCRKTLATPNIDDNRRPEYLAANTFPYGYVTKFADRDYDVEEFKISDDNHAELVDLIAGGQNALALWPHDPRPVMTVQAPLAPGDFFDRLAVLTVKRARFEPRKRAAIEREFQRLTEIRRQLDIPRETLDVFDRLVELHAKCYDALAEVVPAALNNVVTGQHLYVIKANKDRVALKAEIDHLCHAPYGEVKDYYPTEEQDDGP